MNNYKTNKHTSKKYNSKRLKRTFRKHLLYSVISICIILITSATIMLKADAKDSSLPNNVEKKYESIVIKNGDTLWSIAEKYADTKYISISDYINELKIMNNLSDNNITYGANLLITYYSVED